MKDMGFQSDAIKDIFLELNAEKTKYTGSSACRALKESRE
jgi:hypothetical protein